MGFIEQNLTNNEKIVHKGHLHWFAYAGGLALIAARNGTLPRYGS